MQAIIRTKPGKAFSTMAVQDIASPTPGPGELKISMTSSRINPVDMDLMKGFPTLRYKQPQIGGIDGAGTVVETGHGVTGFSPGDKVFFYRKFSDIGTWAEAITIPATYCARVPEQIGLAEAGAIALPLLTAYDSLTQLGAKPGEKILIHGAGGGVGFQAVQVAKQMGLYVIGTAGAADRAVLAQAGLEQFIDYKTDDFATVLSKGSVDYILDVLGGDVLKKSIVLQPKTVVSLKYVDVANMHKAGVNLPGIMKWLMKLMMAGFTRLARQNKVKLIGQVTGADGPLLQQAVEFIVPVFISRPFVTRTLADIASAGMSNSDLGKVILFE